MRSDDDIELTKNIIVEGAQKQATINAGLVRLYAYAFDQIQPATLSETDYELADRSKLLADCLNELHGHSGTPGIIDKISKAETVGDIAAVLTPINPLIAFHEGASSMLQQFFSGCEYYLYGYYGERVRSAARQQSARIGSTTPKIGSGKSSRGR